MRTFTVRTKSDPGTARLVFEATREGFLVFDDAGKPEWLPIEDCALGAVFWTAEERLWWQSLSAGDEHAHGGEG